MKPHLLHVFPAFGHGGPEVRTALIVNETADRFRHTILSINGDLSGGVRILVNGDKRLAPLRPANAWGGPARALAQTFTAMRPDLVLTYGWGGIDAILAGRLCGYRRILHAEDGFLPDEAHGQKFPRLLARQLLLRAAARVVCPSRTLVGIASRLWRLPRRKVHYLPNGVDATRFCPGTPEQRDMARRRFGFSGKEIVIGTVGHLRAEKNQARLIKAFAQLPNHLSVRLLLVGDGNLRGTLERQVRDLRLASRVVFTGVIPDPADCYHAMDLFALSSDTEQMPIAVLEAMSAGLAVVSTDVGDVREMVSDTNRPYVVTRCDDAAYARALERLANGADERAALGRLNRARAVDFFDLRGMVDRYEQLYDEMLTS
jgi:glycosyltransferase involved in cell wall biosynthesis